MIQQKFVQTEEEFLKRHVIYTADYGYYLEASYAAGDGLYKTLLTCSLIKRITTEKDHTTWIVSKLIVF